MKPSLPQTRQRTTFEILLSQFRSLIVLLLAAASAIEVAMGDHVEAIAILVVIILNAAIGFFTERILGCCCRQTGCLHGKHICEHRLASV